MQQTTDSAIDWRRRLVAATVLATSLVIGLAVVGAVNVLANLDEPSADFSVEALAVGNLWGLFSSRSAWVAAPIEFSTLLHCVDLYSLMLVVGMVATVVFVMRMKQRMSWTAVSLACLVAGSMPYVDGWLVLRQGTTSPSECGPYLAMMLLGLLYGAIFAATFALWDLRGDVARATKWLRQFPRLSWRTHPAPS